MNVIEINRTLMNQLMSEETKTYARLYWSLQSKMKKTQKEHEDELEILTDECEKLKNNLKDYNHILSKNKAFK